MEKALLLPAFFLYLAAAGLYFGGLWLEWLRKVSIAVFAAGFAINAAASLHRWITAGHMPFSNMFETMMTLGACMFFMFLYSEFGSRNRTGWIDAALAAVAVFPSAFVFSDEVKPLPPALQSSLFGPHVITYLLAYAACARAAILSVISLAHRGSEDYRDFEKAAFRATAIAFPLLTIGLLLGGVWAARAWGSYWSWDPKEVWALNTWIIYLVYFHLRIGSRGKSWTVDAANLAGFAAIVITLLVVNLSRIFGGGLHSYA